MLKSKRYEYTYEDFDEADKTSKTMIPEILADDDLPHLKEIIIGCWGNSWDDSSQSIIDDIVNNADRFSHIKSLFIGDMDYEECEVSWIIQGNYSTLFPALPNLKKLTIKGSSALDLGDNIQHNNLEELTIICGGLPSSVIESIKNAKFPNLKHLNLYIGVEDYGFDGDIDTIAALLSESDFPKLKYLGLGDSEIQNEVTETVIKSKYMAQIHTLDLSNGNLTDEGGRLLLEAIPNYPNIQVLDLHYHYLSDEMMEKLKKLPLKVNLDEQNEADDEDDCYPCLTE